MDVLTVPVEGSERLLGVFGPWPSFHDAEVITMDFWRGDICPERNSWIAPVLTVKIQVLEATQAGAQHAGDDILLTLRFHDVFDIRLADFNHQNAILGLTLEHESCSEGVTPSIPVRFEQAFGVAASFRCRRVEVVNAAPWQPIPALL
jgi:hypothetical protein